jgi:hypothetical protein
MWAASTSARPPRVDELEAGDGAAAVIGFQHLAAEDAVADGPRGVGGDAIALHVKDKGGVFFLEDAADRFRRHPGAGQQRFFVRHAQIEDSIEIRQRDGAYGRLSASGDPAGLVQHTALDHPFRP